MFPGRLGYEIAILAVICTVAIFLFPTARGPYSVVHGPVTALLGLRAKLKLWLAMDLAALRLLRHVRPYRLPAPALGPAKDSATAGDSSRAHRDHSLLTTASLA
ncbi:MAG: hypothetical protein WB510_20145, partial [Candidatus Sulfotelmatobacter sp.]